MVSQDEDFNSSELVVGDLVFLELGNMIPADIYMVSRLAPDQVGSNGSLLTGGTARVPADRLRHG